MTSDTAVQLYLWLDGSCLESKVFVFSHTKACFFVVVFFFLKKRAFVARLTAQDQLNKQRAAEMRLDAERKRLREALEAAEARATRVELGRRSLEGELQRLKLGLGDREVESQNSQERYDSLMKQVQQDEHIPEFQLV